MRLLCLLMAGALTLGTPAQPAAQERTDEAPRPKLIISERAIAAGLAAASPARVQARRDSLKNGAVAGAVIGGLALGIFAGVLCHALHEEGNPSCWPGTLLLGAVGAGIGAAAGAGIDALATQRDPGPLSTWRTQPRQ